MFIPALFYEVMSYLSHISPDICPEVGLLDHMVGLFFLCVCVFFFFWEISILFSTAAVPVYTPSLLWENLSSTVIFQLVGCPPGGYEMSLYCESILHTILLWLLFLVFECRLSLLVGSSLSCHRLFSSYLWFWCLCERRWAQVFLLCCVVSLPGK